MKLNRILQGNVLDRLKDLPDLSIQCVVTSPPYWGLRDYGSNGQLGLEETPEEFVENLVKVFREVKRVIKDDGTVWLNLGDSYASSPKGNKTESGLQSKSYGIGKDVPMKKNINWGECNLKPKDLVGIPWRVAFALQADGWYLRQDIIWHKPNPMPESVTDRCTKAHEYIFLLSKSAKYFYNHISIQEKANYDGRKDTIMKGSEKYKNSGHIFAARGHIRWHENEDGIKIRNKRSVWSINTKPYKEAHFAVFPPKLPELCIKAGSSEGDIVLDPFFGSGTTGWVAQRLGRKWIGIELNPEYIKIAEKRFIQQDLFV
ncbi:MAG: site-specific DNA-methyltransferase [Candidatus Jacksonbacteria bacterium]|nr:site-specific DNA-methyltransferase [Candidatus Jacksonbacteria bacterium]